MLRTNGNSVREPSIQAITFDVGGTLIRPWPSVGHVYAEAAAYHGHPGLSPATLNQRFTEAWRHLKGFQHTRSEWAALVDATFGELVAPPPSRTFFDQLYERFGEPGAWQIFPDVFPTLNALARSGIKLGVISNWDERLRPLLRMLELENFFAAVAISCEVGSPKPNPPIFLKAAAVLGLPPQTILHVGDSVEMDVVGASKAGFQALLLRREGPLSSAGQIRSLKELISFSVRQV